MKNRILLSLLIVLSLAFATSPSCDFTEEEWDEFFDVLLGAPIREPLTGQNAFLYLQKDPNMSSSMDRDALLGALAVAEDEETVSDPGYEVVDLLQSTIHSRSAIRQENFKIPPTTAFPPRPYSEGKADSLYVDLGGLQSEYLIPHLEAIPIRNQGARGTCAAFTGVGHLEYAALKKNPNLKDVDLSEQRYYYLSKPECYSTGCSLDQEGSWYAVAMEQSVAEPDLLIPHEDDCPYESELGANDIQIPQDQSCEIGALKVVQMKYVVDPEEIISVLENDGLPVPYASKLSNNWRYNTGLITLAESGGAAEMDKHSGGHAYLIVGYRKLPDRPDEGGMCFVIKNSWGTGWGVNGYSCMTLKWMEVWGFNYYQHPVAMDVMIDESKFGVEEEDDPEPPPDYFDPDTYDDDTVDWDDYDDGDEDEIPEPDPEPEPIKPEWTSMPVKGPDNRYYRGEVMMDETKAMWRGYIRNRDIPTGAVTLELYKDELYFDGDRVGEVRDNHLLICTGAYSVLCSLRLDKDKNDLYVEFVNPEYRRIKAGDLKGGAWQWLFDPNDGLGFGLEFFNADDLGERLLQRYVVVRLTDFNGNATEAMRLSLEGFTLKLMGEEIGSIDPAVWSLCSGKYKKNCKLYNSRHGLTIYPSFRGAE